MLKLQGIQMNAAILGIDPGPVVRVITTELVDDNALTAYYKTADGKLLDRMLLRTDTANLFCRPWAFDMPGEAFKLAAEVYRISLAHLYDLMMAVHSSYVEPLPRDPRRLESSGLVHSGHRTRRWRRLRRGILCDQANP